jgi:hypothetical protein
MLQLLHFIAVGTGIVVAAWQQNLPAMVVLGLWAGYMHTRRAPA